MRLSARELRLRADVCSQGRQRYWQGIQVDITEQKGAEEVLRDSELRLRTVITNAPVVLFALDNRGVITLSEGKGLEALGLEPNETVGHSVFDLYRDSLSAGALPRGPRSLHKTHTALGGASFRLNQ